MLTSISGQKPFQASDRLMVVCQVWWLFLQGFFQTILAPFANPALVQLICRDYLHSSRSRGGGFALST